MLDVGQTLKTSEEYKAAIAAAITEGNEEAISSAILDMADGLQAKFIEEYRKTNNDSNVMKERNGYVLTNEEREYYTEVITAGGFEGIQKIVPPTIINRVFDDMVREHPILQAVDAVNGNGITKWIMHTEGAQLAAWGKLCSPITEELGDTFEEISLDKYKLSAFVPVCKAMLALGPEWLDRYIVTLLSESLYNGLESAIISGNGSDMPIGMDRDLDGAVVGGVYPQKTAIAITDLSPATLGSKIMAPLTKNGIRAVNEVFIAVNPVDYWQRIFPETIYLSDGGAYVANVWPIPVNVVQSPYVAAGTMIAGIAKDYFLGLGGNARIEYSDEFRLLEDERVYTARQYANGQPKDNNSFILFDITGINPVTP